MSNVLSLSEELAAEHGVDESEMWGFLLGGSLKGWNIEEARWRAKQTYGDTDG